MELAQLPARLDAELVDERPSGGLVDVERLGLPTAPVEREHQQRAEPLTQRMLGGERLELRDQVWPATEREICLDPFLENRQPPFLEAADLLPRETGVGDVGQGRATPQREGVDQLPAPLAGEALETLGVELVGFDPDRVPGRPGRDPVPAQPSPEVGDVHLKRLLGGVRRALLPQGVDQPVPRHDLIGMEEQHGEERPLLRAAEIERLPAGDHLQRAEDPKFHLPPPGRGYR